MWLRFYVEDKTGVPIIDSIPHCHSESALKRGKNQEIYVASLLYRERLRYYIEDKVGVCIIDSIPHCHTKKSFKRGENQEMWLRFYIEGGQNWRIYHR